MTLDQEEKQRLAQLGKDRRLSEAVGALDTTASEFLRIAGEENAEDELVMQAASNYRAAVQRRNVAYDEACGIEPGATGEATVVTHEVDEDKLREQVQAILADEVAKAQASEPEPPASEKGNSQPPAGGGQKAEGGGSKPPEGKGGAKAS